MLLHIGNKSGSRHIGSTQLGSSTLCGLLTRLDYFRLSLISTNRSRTCWAELWFVRRCEKKYRWMVRSKRGRFLLTWYSQIAQKLGKLYNKRWSIFFIILRNLTCFLEEKFAFRTYTPGISITSCHRFFGKFYFFSIVDSFLFTNVDISPDVMDEWFPFLNCQNFPPNFSWMLRKRQQRTTKERITRRRFTALMDTSDQRQHFPVSLWRSLNVGWSMFSISSVACD